MYSLKFTVCAVLVCAFVLSPAAGCRKKRGEPGCQLYNAGDSYTHNVSGNDAKIVCWNKRNRCTVKLSYYALDKNGQRIARGSVGCTFDDTVTKTLNPNGIKKIRIVNDGGSTCGDWVAVWN